LASRNSSTKRIAIAGGGFAGLRTALTLSRLLRRDDVKISLIDRECYHLYHALLYEVATADFLLDTVASPISEGVCIPLKAFPHLLHATNIDFQQDEILGIDATKRQLKLRYAGTTSADALVLALGAVVNDYGIPGVERFARKMQTLDDALAIRNTIKRLFSLCSRYGCPTRRIVICGGGFTGVELAGELLHFLRRLAHLHALERQKVQLVVLEAGPQLFPGFDPELARRAYQRLSDLGADIRLNQRVTKVTADGVVVDGKLMASDLVVWTAGVKANPLQAKAKGLTVDKRGRIIVDQTLQAKGAPGVYAIGDGASFTPPRGKPLPGTAAVAIQEGEYVAKAIARQFRGKKAVSFKPTFTGFVVPIGGKFALSTLHGVRGGFFAWLDRKRVDFRYFRSILPFWRALDVWLRGARLYLKND
jgi:NADH dehydrogenase